jgi:citrate lyase subunit beta / citryl-CoA lyase
MTHPRDALFEPGEHPPADIPVCDHYAGVEERMRKALDTQLEMGPVFDVTLDNEDGAPVGGEAEHAHMIRELLASPLNGFGRVAVRVLPVEHPKFDEVLHIVLGGTRKPCHVMLPKPVGVENVDRAAKALDAAGAADVPLHALIETHGALRDVEAIAAHPRIESLSFGLMDFVSAHHGAIPASAMGVKGQFEHPLVIRAKLEIAAACIGHGKVPSHSVVMEFKHRRAIEDAASRACSQLGYLRMWSIHPMQIRPIVEAFTPSTAEVDLSIEIITAAQNAQWAPVRHHDTLHDRASYRYFWRVIERAHRTTFAHGSQLPEEVRRLWFADDVPMPSTARAPTPFQARLLRR